MCLTLVTADEFDVEAEVPSPGSMPFEALDKLLNFWSLESWEYIIQNYRGILDYSLKNVQNFG